MQGDIKSLANDFQGARRRPVSDGKNGSVSRNGKFGNYEIDLILRYNFLNRSVLKIPVRIVGAVARGSSLVLVKHLMRGLKRQLFFCF